MRRRSVWTGVVITLAALAVAPACALKPDFKAEVRGYLQHTEALARSYAYTETSAGGQRVVEVKVADDLTYSADYTLNGTPEMSEVVKDDSRALRISDPALLRGLIAPAAPAATPSPAPAATPSPAPDGGTLGFQPAAPAAASAPQPGEVLAALRGGQWVLDPSGASSLVRAKASGQQTQIGQDPVADSLDVLNYFDQNLDAVSSDQVVKFNSEAGGYFKDLDPFPWPAAGVTRYDVNESPQLPAPGALQNAGDARGLLVNTLPAYFKTDAIYVRNGVVVDVRESIDIKRRLELPDQNLMALVENALTLLNPRLHFPNDLASRPLADQDHVLLAILNSYYAQGGDSLLRERQLNVAFTFGAPPVVTVPPTDQRGSLNAVLNHGQILGGPAI